MLPEVDFYSGFPLVTFLISVFAVLAAAGALAALLVPKVAERILPKPKETRLADFLPFERIEQDGRTVICRNGTRVRFICVSGIDQNFLSREEARNLFNARKNLFDALAEAGVVLRIFTVREPTEVPREGGFPNETAAEIARSWNRKFERAYVTRAVLAISAKADSRADERLDEAEQHIEGNLAKYNPKPLTQNPETSPSGDLTIGAFLGRLAAPISQPRPNGFGDYLSDVLANDEIEFHRNGRITFRSGDRLKHCSVMGIRRLGEATSTEVANQLSALSAEATILQTVEYMPKVKLIPVLQQNQRMMSTTSFTSDVYAQYQAVIEMVEGADEYKAALCFFTETVFLYADDEEELARIEKECRQIFVNAGMSAVIEKGATQASWFMQFPTYETKPRVYRLMSTNVAQMSTFDRPSAGLPRSDWGEGPIARFYTGQNSVYQHQFHISTQAAAVGHGVVIAPTGAGKTVLLEFLATMASRHENLKVFSFDRFQGQYIWTCAMGGKYLSFNSEKQQQSVAGGMNPFQCEPTEDNIEFLKTWLQGIAKQDDPDSIDQISSAIDIAFSALDRDQRSLAAIYDGAFTAGTPIAEELRKWVDPAQYGEMFNAEEDCIDLDDNWLTTFDMTNLLEDPMLAGASVSYIMHRIRQTLRRNQAPGLIVIDETEPLLRNEHFKRIFFVMLQEFRKLGGVVISVFQRPQAIEERGVSDLVRQQCGTYYMFPNSGASAKDYAAFGLNDREIDFIMGNVQPSRRMKRALLIKRPSVSESVIVDVDLEPLGRHMKTLSSNSRDVARVNEFQRRFGEEWLGKYLESQTD